MSGDLSINLTQRLAIEGEDVFPITSMYDSDGDECGPQDAVVAVAGPTADGQWLSLDLAEFERVAVQ